MELNVLALPCEPPESEVVLPKVMVTMTLSELGPIVEMSSSNVSDNNNNCSSEKHQDMVIGSCNLPKDDELMLSEKRPTIGKLPSSASDNSNDDDCSSGKYPEMVIGSCDLPKDDEMSLLDVRPKVGISPSSTSDNNNNNNCSSGKHLEMVIGCRYLPKDGELGEDAYFICEKERTMGVADGVGAWSRKGIDAGLYARQLMQNTAHAIEEQYKDKPNMNPYFALKEGFSSTSVDGSSTACVLTLGDNNVLRCVNVGDSGFVVIREGCVAYKSPAQQWEFNFPYQLGRTQDDMDTRDEIEVDAHAWDIIVLGTDGLFDNVFDEEIEELIKVGVTEEKEPPEALALRIANFALVKDRDQDSTTPFAQAASEAGWKLQGGKYDDITVLVAYVLPLNQAILKC